MASDPVNPGNKMGTAALTAAKIRWNLMEVMSRRGVRFSSQLRDMLADCGVGLSVQHVNRLVSGTPKKLSIDILSGLCVALSCTPGDLLTVSGEDARTHGNGKSVGKAVRKQARRREKQAKKEG